MGLLEPMGSHYGRGKVSGKLIRQSLETKDFKVAKTKVRHWLIDVRGRVNSLEVTVGSLMEEHQRGLQIAVNSQIVILEPALPR